MLTFSLMRQCTCDGRQLISRYNLVWSRCGNGAFYLASQITIKWGTTPNGHTNHCDVPFEEKTLLDNIQEDRKRKECFETPRIVALCGVICIYMNIIGLTSIEDDAK